MASYNNDLRLKEIATGAESGTWGTSTNTNLSLVAEAFSFGTEAITTNADTHTTTIADGATDPGRSLYLKYTGALDSDCTITLAPNTVSKVWFIENATTDSGSGGPYNIIISQGSGSNVTIANGSVMAVYSDGGGSSANIVSVLTDVVLTDSVKITGTTPTLTIGDGGAEDTKVIFDGNAQDYYLGLDDTDDTLQLGRGSTLGTNTDLSLATNGRVGIGETVPLGNLHIKSSDAGSFTPTSGATELIVEGGGDSGIQIISANDATGFFCFGHPSDPDEGKITYTHDADDTMTFTAGSAFSFKKGITTQATLNSAGDLNILTADKGVVLKSANGTQYRVTVSNAGALVVTAI
tara:strand:+ start:59 stop:1111 length:1053 start_codon:yes stop_codon:yes gene_type:complete